MDQMTHKEVTKVTGLGRQSVTRYAQLYLGKKATGQGTALEYSRWDCIMLLLAQEIVSSGIPITKRGTAGIIQLVNRHRAMITHNRMALWRLTLRAIVGRERDSSFFTVELNGPPDLSVPSRDGPVPLRYEVKMRMDRIPSRQRYCTAEYELDVLVDEIMREVYADE